ncbi:MAG TPA: peptide deformylase [Candidatus Coprousia avicola]|nr:peptide deformylase [Candidatus Coprousia avicola]
MIRPIMTSRIILSRPAADAAPGDEPHAQDLLDTFAAHRTACVGMAANMIGVLKRLIVFSADGTADGPARLMYNPEVVEAAEPYETQEGCLSLPGARPCTRYRRITVRYQDEGWRERTERFSGYTAEVIQHEIDHTAGILI